VLKAVVEGYGQPLPEAVHWAAKAGQILGYCAIAFGIAVDWFTGQLVNGL